MELFVENKNIEVVVFVWEDNEEEVEATYDKDDVPKDKEVKEYIFRFKKPNYKDSTAILKSAGIKSDQEGPTADLTTFTDQILRSLLVEIVDGEKVITPTQNRINQLEPAIARAAIAGVLDIINL